MGLSTIRTFQKFPIHSFLFGIFPILFLYQINKSEVYLDDTFLPLAVCILIITIVLGLFSLLYQSMKKAAVFCSVLVLLIFSHNSVRSLIGHIDIPVGRFAIGEDKILLTTWIVVLVALGIYLLRLKRELRQVTNLLNLISFFLVTYNLVILVPFFVSQKASVFSFVALHQESVDIGRENTSNDSDKPDIYFLIFDRYPSEKSALENFNYDNSAFTDFLKNKGFFVADSARTNYPRSGLSIGSLMNLEYWDTLINRKKDQLIEDRLLNPDSEFIATETSVVFPFLKNDYVGKYLKSQGYTYNHIGGWYSPTNASRVSDRNYFYLSYIQRHDFIRILISETAIFPIIDKYFSISMNETQRDHINYEMSTINDLINAPSPKFIFAHVLFPHPPYVFDENCNFHADENPGTTKEKFLAQLTCATGQIEDTVTNILENSIKPPVIILIADEGIGLSMVDQLGDYKFVEGGDQYIRERTQTLSAFYTPGFSETPYYSSISPVNIFRILFNNYFDTNYELLPDKTYIFDLKNEFSELNFTEVTDIVSKNY